MGNYTSMSVDDIRKIRNKQDEKMKNMTQKERISYIHKTAKPAMDELKRRRAEKERKEN